MFIYGLFKHSYKVHSDVDSFDDCHSAFFIKIKNIKSCQQEPSVCSCLLNHPPLPPGWGKGDGDCLGPCRRYLVYFTIHSWSVCSLICMLFLIHLVKILLSFFLSFFSFSQSIIRVFWHTWCVMDYSGAFAHAKHVQQSTLSLAKSIYVMILIGRNFACGSCEILFSLLSIFCGHYIS